jgi:hypothetical protein
MIYGMAEHLKGNACKYAIIAVLLDEEILPKDLCR